MLERRRMPLVAALAATSVVVSLGCAMAGSACAEPLRAAGAASPPRQPPLQLGARGAPVRALQRRLIALGYLPAGAADGAFGQRTWHAVVAFEGWQRLHRDGVVEGRTRAALASATRPRPWVRLERGLLLDLERQVLLVVEGGRTVRAVHVSTARPGYVTPRGRFEVYRRERLSWSASYGVWMPYALYFSGGYAIHGYGVVPASPASHGCVRVPESEAPYVYAAAPLHTAVVIR
jgi:peptidoglycan hydrolase-like protein with peptidoglycan-binding domain